MTGKTHIAIGTAAALYLLPAAGVRVEPLMLAGAVLGSLLPDIEHPKAMVNSKILPIKSKSMLVIMSAAAGILLILGGLADKSLLKQLIGVYILIAGQSSHRTFTHSLLGLSSIVYISYQLSVYRGFQGFAAGLAVGTALHILADSFTSGGVSLLYPLYNKRIGFPIAMKTGGLTERVIFIISLIVAVISIMSF